MLRFAMVVVMVASGCADEPACPVSNATLENNGVSIVGNIATVHVRYQGGCGTHKYFLGWDGTMRDTTPPQVTLNLVYQSFDECTDDLQEQLQVDLSSLPFDYAHISIDNNEAGVWQRTTEGVTPPAIPVTRCD